MDKQIERNHFIYNNAGETLMCTKVEPYKNSHKEKVDCETNGTGRDGKIDGKKDKHLSSFVSK